MDFVGAGRRDTGYSARLLSFNWEAFYNRLGGGVFLQAVKERLRDEYDYVLIDSRTGVGDTSAICTIDLPDAIVACFNLKPYSIEGTVSVVSHISESTRARTDPPIIFPVPMRIENTEKQRLDQVFRLARLKFDPFLDHIPIGQRKTYWDEVAFPYEPFYTYGEMLYAVIEDAHPASLLASSERLVSYLTNGEVQHCLPVSPAEREHFLSQYSQNPLP